MFKKTYNILTEPKYHLLKHGIFCLNKEEKITSAQVVTLVKRALMKDLGWNKTHLKLKVGHGGTLDYGATGVLVIGINSGCKTLTNFLHGSKSYLVSGKFGEATDTYNDIGKVTHSSTFDHITEQKLVQCLKCFCGNIMQIPPLYSALKLNGKRISDLVREGKIVNLSPRPVRSYKIKCVSYSPPNFTLLVSCGGGFYIRSLVHDLGIALHSHAHVTRLCRTKQGPLMLQDCLSMDQISLDHILQACQHIQMKYSKWFSVFEQV